MTCCKVGNTLPDIQRRGRVLLLCCLFFFLITSDSHGAVRYHPSLKWWTIETEHFYIHYYEGEDALAKIAAVYAEDVYVRLTESLNWIPTMKTHVVITGTTDFANGMATPFPYNLIILYALPPELDSAIGYYNNWLYLLIAHEYTHILQLEQARGLAKLNRYIFGRTPFTILPPFTTFPNALMPNWLIEGIATFEESKLTGTGRVNSTLMNNIIGEAVAENRFPESGMGNGDVITWPWHGFPYFYGGEFYKFLSEYYGDNAIASFHNQYSGQVLPLFLNTASYRAFGGSFNELWLRWKTEERKKYKDSQGKNKGAVTRLTKSGYFTRGPKISPSGRYILYNTNNPFEYPSVRIYDTAENNEKMLFKRNYGIDFAWSPDSGGFYFTQAEINRNFFTYNDLYFHSLINNRTERITHGVRITEFAISPDNESGVGVVFADGARRLARINLKDGRVEFLTDNGWEDGYYNPQVSPDGVNVVFVRGRMDGSREIGIMDIGSRNIKVIDIPGAFHFSPQWTPDGGYIIFSSDMEGSQRLYAYSVQGEKLYSLGNIDATAYESSIWPDGSVILFTGYSADGFDIYAADLSEEFFIEIHPDAEKHPESKLEIGAENVVKDKRRYSAFYPLLPKFWMPLAFYSSDAGWYLSATTFNSDPLARHSYNIMAEYYPSYGYSGVSFSYQNDLLMPSLGVRYRYIPVRRECSNCSGNKNYWLREQGGTAYVQQLFRRFRYSWTLGLHYSFTGYNFIDPPVGGLIEYAGAGAEVFFENAKSYDFTPGRQDGRIIALGFRKYDKSLGSDFAFNKAVLDYREYLTLGRNKVLAMKMIGGFIWESDRGGDNLFSVGGITPRMDETLFGLDSAYMFLRGYPYNVDVGSKALVFSAEYRFPPLKLDAGIKTFPFFMRKLHFSVFGDYGKAWDNTVSIRDFRASVGVEFKWDNTIIYHYNITQSLGFVKGFSRDGISQFYLLLGSSF